MRNANRRLVLLSGIAASVSGAAVARGAPAVSTPFASRFQLATATLPGDALMPTQMAWGPDDRLYVTRFNGETSSYAFNPVTGALGDKRGSGVNLAFGIAFANHATPGEPARNYLYVCRNQNYQGSIARLSDDNGNGLWGEAGETNVEIVRGVPYGDHTLDQIQVRGNQLFIGLGARTNNGRTGDNTGQNFHDTPEGPVFGGFGQGKNSFTYGETSYNGAIGTIKDLTLVPNVTSAAQLREGPNGTSGNLLAGRDAFLPTSPHAHLPYTSTASDKLVVHSAGTRNPYGLALRANGDLWFTNNYGRADTNGDGTSTPHFHDLLDSDLADDVHDQLFRATPGGDYRYDNENFRGNPNFPNTTVVSTTFDNLDASHPNFGQLHDPADPIGLGPSSSANGFDFGTMDLTGLLATDAREYALISRWSQEIAEEPPGTDVITFADYVVVDPETGNARRILEGFANPIDAINDRTGGFLLADWGSGTIYRLTPRAQTSTWVHTGWGSWSQASHWDGPVPDFVGAVANFTGAITQNATVHLDANRVLGTLNFDNPAFGYNLSGAGVHSVLINVSAGLGAINCLAGDHAITSRVEYQDSTRITVASGASLFMSGEQFSSAGVTLTKAGPGLLQIRQLNADAVVLEQGVTWIIFNGTIAGRSKTKSLMLAGGTTPTATLDLQNNAFVVDYDGANSPIQTVLAQIRHAHNGGAWDRPGITTTEDPSRRHAVGYAERAALSSVPSIFGAVDDTSLLLRVVRFGDADLSDNVNLNDFNALAANFGGAGKFWWQGDFNYDTVVNLNDFNLLAANFGFVAAGPEVTPRDWARLAAAVPEPGGGLALCVAPMLLGGIARGRVRRDARSQTPSRAAPAPRVPLPAPNR